MASFQARLAQNIRDARLGREMTQKELAQQIGVTPVCISFYETSKRMPSVEVMSRISDALGMSLDDMVPHVEHDAHVDPCQTTVFDFLIGEEDV